MKRLARYSFWVLSSAILLLPLNAQTDTQSKLVGKWTLNTAKWKSEGAVPRPKQATLVISQATSVHFKWELKTTFSNGGRSVMGFDGAIDGKSYVYKGAERGTRLAFVENNGILEGTATSPNGGTVRQTVTLSPDGNTMTAQCSSNFPPATASWTEVWERSLDKKRK